jgi:hypothetical protein
MANLLQSAQTQATQAPGFFTDYLSNLATKGREAQAQAQYVGAQPLQTQAFEAAQRNLGLQQPTFEAGRNLLTQAAGQDITGAVNPYLQAATGVSPLSAAQPLISQSAGLDLGCVAGSYMSPYIQNAVQSLSDIGQRNIMQNLSPMATAAAVGSGQYGSQRGAQVLGQLTRQAEQDLNAQIAQMLNQGYGQALCAAKSKQSALAQLAQTTSAAQQAQNEANLRAATAAGCAAYKEASAAQQAGVGLGTLGQQASGVNLACINALATLGGQQQTIAQNQQMFPLTSLSSLASLLSGYSIPTTTRTTLCMSPFSGLAALGAGAIGLSTPNAKCVTPYDQIIKTLKKAFPSSGSGSTSSGGNVSDQSQEEGTGGGYWGGGDFAGGGGCSIGCGGQGIFPDIGCGGQGSTDFYCCGFARGGKVQSRAIGGGIGCGSTMGMGAAPAGLSYAACLTCLPVNANGSMASGMNVGCASTQNLGALPNMG